MGNLPEMRCGGCECEHVNPLVAAATRLYIRVQTATPAGRTYMRTSNGQVLQARRRSFGGRGRMRVSCQEKGRRGRGRGRGRARSGVGPRPLVTCTASRRRRVHTVRAVLPTHRAKPDEPPHKYTLQHRADGLASSVSRSHRKSCKVTWPPLGTEDTISTLGRASASAVPDAHLPPIRP